MSVVAEMLRPANLEHEWKRIEMLAQCLLESRNGRQPADSQIKQLRELQHQVEFGRKDQGLWDVANYRLPDLALDLLACVYAPLANPDVALLFQDLQQNRSIYPDLMLVYRLLALEEEEYRQLQALLHPEGLLPQQNLLIVEGELPLLQLKPHPLAVAQITGLPGQRLSVPGATAIKLAASWDDLVIPQAQQQILQEFLLWIAHGPEVIKDWGGNSAGGPIALFSGPSGTGKTYAASVIANELGWQLYRVDLGALVSKYIGETEKNLNALFDAVQGQNILLQFDEVDALMGKRGEIRDARDRYANMEVSHLLSRIEQHQGPCILTTNLRKHIDQAFQRRFHFVVSFPRPQIPERLLLWQKLLPPKAPLAADMDLQEVAGAVALTGGEIRNAAMHAAVLAKAESAQISMPHIATGVWRVLQKADSQARQNQLRQLAAYLPADAITGSPDE